MAASDAGRSIAGRHRSRRALSLLPAALALAVPAAAVPAPAVPEGSRYVAMGSSFAAGPGLPPEGAGKPDRCQRSSANYAHLLARRRHLDLVDVSCGGATTANVLGRWGELPAQVDAVTPGTRLVTITIGGNDVGFVAGLIAASLCRTMPAGSRCREMPAPDEKTWTAAEDGMRRIVAEIRRRAPGARIVFVDYLTVLPATGTCDALPLTPAQEEASRRTAGRLAALTVRVAGENGAEVLRASALSRGHDACGAVPWANGWTAAGAGAGRVPFHPNAAGMAAIADALDRLLAGG